MRFSKIRSGVSLARTCRRSPRPGIGTRTLDALRQILPNLLAVLAIFTAGGASPGLATLMIAGTAMARGRVPAVAPKLAGGAYLIVPAVKSWRSAVTPNGSALGSAGPGNLGRCFAQGVLLHLTTPKAPLVWLATLSAGVGEDAPAAFLTTAVPACTVVATGVFVGYACLFSVRAVARACLSVRRPVDALLGLVFGAAAVRIPTCEPY